MQWLAELCVRRPVFASVLSIVILVVGGVFYRQLGIDQFPKIDFPVIVVFTTQPGASPEDVEREITDKVEGAVNTISGIDELRSNSSEGISQVVVQFVLEKDVDVAAQEVQQKVNSVLADLPRGIDPPVVQKFDPDSFPILYIAINARAPEGEAALGAGARIREITDVADRIVRRRIEAVSGVGQATLIGGRKRQIDVKVDPVKLRALGLSATEVAGAINAQNITLPAGRVEVSRTATDAVFEHLVLGALLAAVVVLIFLGNVRSTVIAALAIPTSIVGTFAAMKLAGYTLNSITLLALALAVGIVIDDAIVVLENIFRHVEEKGMDPKKAAVAGTREIGTAVLATTLSLIAVFLPIAFVAGIPGRFLRSFGITMSMAVAVSLFVSFTLTPMLASRWLRRRRAGDHRKSMLERLGDVGYRPVERGYGRLLDFAMRRRWLIVALSVGALISTVPLGIAARKGFLPVDDRAQFEVVVRLPEGRS